MICKAVLVANDSREWYCTLHDGHPGEHKAFGVLGELPLRTWPDSPRVWSLPAEPEPEVTAVWDASGERWTLHGGGWRCSTDDPDSLLISWENLLVDFGPLTDAIPTTEETKP